MNRKLIAILTILVLGISILTYFPSTRMNYHDRLDKMFLYSLVLFIGTVLFYKDKWLLSLLIWLCICLVHREAPVCIKRFHLLFFGMIFFRLLSLYLDDRGIYWILNGISAICLIHIFFIVLQANGIRFLYYVIPKYINSGLHPGVLADTNAAGSLLAISSISFIRPNNKLYLLGFIPVFYGLYIVQALAGVLALFVGLLIYFLFYVKVSKKLKISFILILTTMVLGYMKVREPAKFRGNLGMRGEMIPVVVKQIKLEPIFGYGLGSFYWLFQVHYKELYKSRTFMGRKVYTTWRRCHNDWLEVTYNWGIIGLLFLLGLFYSNINRFLKSNSGLTYGSIGLIGIMVSFTNAGMHFLFHTPVILISIVYFAIMVNRTEIKEVFNGKENGTG